ncbi:MAG: glutamate synthase [Sulfolobales archaeon]
MMRYEPSGCGILGILRKKDSRRIRGEEVVRAIERVRYRGSDKGAGFAVFNLEEGSVGSNHRYYVKIFVEKDPGVLAEVFRELAAYGVRVVSHSVEVCSKNICSHRLGVEASSTTILKKAIMKLDTLLWIKGVGKVYSAGRSVDVYKGVGYPGDIARLYGIHNIEGDMWLAHTRQPTNSPGHYPYWSHPFATFDIAIVHNGDLSSFGANIEFLSSRGWGGFVGTDSEVVAMLFDQLLSEGYDVEDAVKILANPSRKHHILDPSTDYIYRNARLDGPFTAIIGYSSGDDIYMIVIADRSKFRPVILAEDQEWIYAASEESEVRELSPNARVWTLKPGYYFIASYKKGIISYGRPEEELESFSPPPIFTPEGFDIDARYIDYRGLDNEIARVASTKNVVRIANVMGHRYIGISLPRRGVKNIRIELYGVVGNCLANLNEANYFYVYGNVGDDCGDTMHGGKVVITGDARDVLAQTLQGGKIFVGGNAGNRVGIQMREYREKRPYLVIGGRVDDYLGEYMAGGVIIILNKNNRSESVGSYVGSGMVGGRIYIRGKVYPARIGPQPPRVEMLRFLKAMAIEGFIKNRDLEDLVEQSYIDLIDKLPEEVMRYARKLYEERIGMPRYEYRELYEEEIRELLPVLEEYGRDLGGDYTELLSDKYTVITARKIVGSR